MTRRKSKRRAAVGSYQGTNLVLISGLPRDTLEWVKRRLMGDTSKRPAHYVGVPAPPNDLKELYTRPNITETLRVIQRETDTHTPHRIIVLYVPSRDSGRLASALDYACFLAPLIPHQDYFHSGGNYIEWRHSKPKVESIVNEALGNALRKTNALKAEITDKRISIFTLPARNFYYPTSDATISGEYSKFAEQGYITSDLKAGLSPIRFTREQLPQNAFKSQQYADRFFQDCRGRIFPPDLYHARSRLNDEVTPPGELSVAIRQRYRFGVTVRDGNLHYDLQYEQPKELVMEHMYCAVDGDVLITASHANVGVNDVIWVPDGKKINRRNKVAPKNSG